MRPLDDSFSVCFDSQKNSNKDGKNKHRQQKKKEQKMIKKRNLSGDEGGNCYNIYKHEIYISIAASYAVILLLLFDDVVCLWRQLRTHTDIEKKYTEYNEKKLIQFSI